MTKLHKFVLGIVGLFALVSFLTPQTYAQAYDTQKHYVHAKKVLEQEYPEFLTAFQTLKDEVKTINSTDKQAQRDAFMRFLPYVDKMADITEFDTLDHWEGHWTLQREVLFTFFCIHLPTADNGHHVTAFSIFTDLTMLSDGHSEEIRLLTEDEMMERHNMSREEAHYLSTVWDKLHRNWPW